MAAGFRQRTASNGVTIKKTSPLWLALSIERSKIKKEQYI